MSAIERPSVPGYWYPAPVLPAALAAGSTAAGDTPEDTAIEELGTHERAVAVLQAVRRFRRSDSAMRSRTASEMAVNSTDLAALRHLVAAARLGDQVSPTELSVHLSISSAATTKLLNRLGQMGHIRREPHPTDRRAQLIVATEEAHSAIRQVLAGSHQRMSSVVASFTAEDQQVVIRFLDALGGAVTENEA